jgi:hypothetical protein
MPAKKYIVRLSEAERAILRGVIQKQNGSAQKVRRAQILLKADADGPGWNDQQIAEAFNCRRQTVENLRQRLVCDGFDLALYGHQRLSSPRVKALSGEQEAQVIALRLGSPPEGFGRWSLRLLSHRVVELGIVESISHETLRQTLKQTR